MTSLSKEDYQFIKDIVSQKMDKGIRCLNGEAKDDLVEYREKLMSYFDLKMGIIEAGEKAGYDEFGTTEEAAAYRKILTEASSHWIKFRNGDISAKALKQFSNNTNKTNGKDVF